MKIEFRSNGLIVDGNRISNIEICSICPLYTPENLERLAAIEVSVKAIQSTYHDFYALGNGSNWGVYI